MRSALKRILITGYCWNLIPASVVSLAFRVFRLRSE